MSIRRLLVATAVTTLVLPLGIAGPAPATSPPGDAQAAAATAVAWQRIAIRTIFTEAATPPAAGGLYLAFASRAVDEAAKDVLRQGGSARAAVATAAHGVLMEYFSTFPNTAANLDADLASVLAAVPDGPVEAKGVRIGEKAAARLIESREDDGRNDLTRVYSKPDEVGYWQPPEVGAPPTGGGMAVAWLGFVDPLVSIRRVRLNGPDRLSSLAYAADYQEVLEKGSSAPTPDLADEALTAQFFAFNPIIMYREAVCTLLTTSPMGLRDTTRLFATIDTAVATSAIETFRLKFEVGFWRPAEAIIDLRDDGNPATEPQPGWLPLVPNPSYSDYTSGHASATAPFAAVMRRTFGDDVTLTLTKPNPAPALPEVRTYTSLSDLEFHALNARIWGGLHFRDAMEDGYHLGHRTARRVMRAMR